MVMGRKKIIIGISGHIFSDQRMKRIASALVEMGYDVEILYRHYFKYKSIETRHSEQTAYSTHAYKIPFKSGIGMYLLLNHRYFWSQLLKPADVYYAVDSDTLPAFTLLSIIKRKPLIYDAHEYFTEVPELKSPWKKSIWDWITKWGVKHSQVRYTVAEGLAKELSKRYGKPFGVVRNVPVLAQTTTTSKQFERPCIIYQGALNEGRQLELLIDAMRQLAECDCYLIGEGDLSVYLRARAKDLKNVYFKGLMSPEELRIITPSCFAGFNLLEAKNSLSYYYSLSNKYFDYMHAGVPSISSHLPEYKLLNTATSAGVCIDDTVDAMVSTIRLWLNNRQIYEKLRENAILASKSYNWGNEKENLKTLIQI